MEDPKHPQTHLFMVRVWLEDLGESKTEYRGKVQHVLSKEAHYFRGWPMLIKILHELILKREDVTSEF